MYIVIHYKSISICLNRNIYTAVTRLAELTGHGYSLSQIQEILRELSLEGMYDLKLILFNMP